MTMKKIEKKKQVRSCDSVREGSVQEAYGFTDKEYSDVVRGCLSVMCAEEKWTGAIDKIFPGLGDEDKLHVFAFAVAFELYNKMSDD